ncbi:MAG: polyamine aminopropyltransferase [Acetobacteraceae bacterium]|nr:polyamine aminopropyltransferase [Acetobacteraceae bacterium]
MELWFKEEQTPHLGIVLRVKETLLRKRSGFQDIAVLDTLQYGRALVLDGIIQTTEGDEFAYHEMLVHVPLLTHPEPRRVLIVGGGDGGAVREVLRHPQVESVFLVEIDREVVEASRRFLPGLSCALDDPRVTVVYQDGAEFVAGAQGEFDVILVDSTDPVGPAVPLFRGPFYSAVARALRPDGLVVAQTESPFVNGPVISQVFGEVRQRFPVARVYLACVPTYPGGMWTFTLGSLRYDPLGPDTGLGRGRPVPSGLRYYSAQIHAAAFALPPFVAPLLGPGP